MSDAIRVKRKYSFTCLPEQLIRDRRVSDRAVRLWALMDRHASGHEAVAITRALLADELDCSLDSIDRALVKLKLTGWLRDNGARGGKPREYELCLAGDEVRTGADNPREVRTGADNSGNEVRTGADNPPHWCGQPSAPVRTTEALTSENAALESREIENHHARARESPPPPQSPPDVDAMIIEEVRQVTGKVISRKWAQGVRALVLGERQVSDPFAYIQRAIRDEPNPQLRFLPAASGLPSARSPAQARLVAGLEPGHRPACDQVRQAIAAAAHARLAYPRGPYVPPPPATT